MDENFIPESTQQPVVPPVTPMTSSSSNGLRPIIIFLVIFVLLAGGYFAVAKYQKLWPFELVMAPSPTATPDDTSNWKTYRNDEYGFEVTFSDIWEGYKVINYSNGIKFTMPSAGLSEQTDVEVFSIDITPKKEWEEILKNGEMAPGRFIAENNNLIYSWINPQDPAGIPFGKIIEEVNKVISTFKFIEPNDKPNNSDTICIQVITQAKNPQTGEIRDFPTPCDVPEGWEKLDGDRESIQ